MHPSLIGCEDDCVFALKCHDLEVEAALITIKDTDTALADLLVGRFCIEKMTCRRHICVTFGPLNPDITFKL